MSNRSLSLNSIIAILMKVDISKIEGISISIYDFINDEAQKGNKKAKELMHSLEELSPMINQFVG